MRGRFNTKGQLTLFVILAIVIVGILIVLIFPAIRDKVFGAGGQASIEGCLETEVQNALDKVMLHGGSIDPTLYYKYEGENIDYICYTNEYYKTCVMQKPLFKQEIEAEIERVIAPKVAECITNVKNRLKGEGYTIETSGTERADIRIIPNNLIVNVDIKIEATKDNKPEPYANFGFEIKSPAYNMIMAASSIASWEAYYGEAATENYMIYYHELKVEKKKQGDGTKIYIITNRNTGTKLQFASRSLAWPPGYAV